MLISPPFLLPRTANETDEQWINRCMVGGEPSEGAFPLSFNLGWHGGMHLIAPINGAQPEPVRAIADGTVVFTRPATPQPPGALDEKTMPLAYRGKWTDNGVVVIRHETEIGEGVHGQVVFFSIYMHLSEVDNALQPNRAVYRKARLGTAGRVYGDTRRQIHFEIVCDDANLRALVGRTVGDLSTDADGRLDAVYGSMYFLLPSGTQFYAQKPLDHLAAAHVQPPRPRRDAQLPAPQALEPIYPRAANAPALVVALRYSGGDGAAGHRGSAWLSTMQLDGTSVGEPMEEEVDAEYNLYARACDISNACPDSARPAPSAVYELLRFGRVVNTANETLTPADLPHWRWARYPGGEGWVNLNAAGVRKFSDADFPHWQQWRLIDDSADQDSRCDSPTLRAWLDASGDGQIEPLEAASRLIDPVLAKRLSRTICKLSTEWDATTIDRRWDWLKTVSTENPSPFNEADFALLRCHIQALAFFPCAGVPADAWHFHPREFIRAFRGFIWLSSVELDRVLASAPAAGRSRAGGLRRSMNLMLRKYLVSNSSIRLSHFLAQVGHETGWWQFREEVGNERYFRTMYEVITSQEAAEDFRSGLAHRLGLVRSGDTEGAYSDRRPIVVAEKARGMDNGIANADAGGRIGDGPRFRGRGFLQITGRRNYQSYGCYRGRDFVSDPNPQLLASIEFNVCDASGFYWVREHANREADTGFVTKTVTRVGGLVNRGSAAKPPKHDNERQGAFAGIWSVLNETF